MSRTYGNKWTSIAESDDGTWLEGLRGLTPAQIRTGYERCLVRYRDWPPTLPQYREACLDIDQAELNIAIRSRAIALSGFDSYYINNHLKPQELQRMMNSVREEVTAEFIDYTIGETSKAALLALENKS